MNFGVLSFIDPTTMKRQIMIVITLMAVVVALPCLAVVSMGTDVLQFLSGTPSLTVAETQGFYTGGPVASDSYQWGNCTYWAYAERVWAGDPIPTSWGNADTWDDRARADGYLVNHTPTVGAIFQTDAGNFGHVAYVTAVDSVSGTWTISEMNLIHLNVIDTRTFRAADANYYNFIHDKKGGQSWKQS